MVCSALHTVVIPHCSVSLLIEDIFNAERGLADKICHACCGLRSCAWPRELLCCALRCLDPKQASCETFLIGCE